MTEDEFKRVIDTYPYPIAGIFRRLGTADCLDPGDPRFKCILGTAENVTRFLSALVLCLCRDYAETNPNAISPSAPLSQNFYQILKEPSWGHWLHFTREGIRWLLRSATVARPGDTRPRHATASRPRPRTAGYPLAR